MYLWCFDSTFYTHYPPQLIIIVGEDFPGYTYDDQRHCYFRVPPKYFMKYSENQKIPKECSVKESVATHFPAIYNHLQERKLKVDGSVDSLRYKNAVMFRYSSQANISDYIDIYYQPWGSRKS